MAAEAASLQVEPVTNVQDLCATEFTSHEPQEHYTASTIGDITRTASQKSKINFSGMEADFEDKHMARRYLVRCLDHCCCCPGRLPCSDLNCPLLTSIELYYLLKLQGKIERNLRILLSTMNISASKFLSSFEAFVGSVILTFPYTSSQVGYKYGILFQFVSGAFGCWTVFLLSWMYAELKQRKMLVGTYQKGHILQYHEVIGGLVGKWGHYITKTFILLSLTFGHTLQPIACSSDVYYMNSNWNK
ncbi:unnamed protein product [Sphagnum jensenii]|uniref:Amino acid transporter transmembrane domain-containing protein n=1 Tax=Sphagnum jensenii TaxID=128206 RepID=A0ABP1BY21_9BRYO